MTHMPISRLNATVGVGLVALLLGGCGSDAASSATAPRSPGASVETSAPSTEPASTQPTATPATPTTPSTTTTPAPTLPPGPPMFDPLAIGSNLILPSFVVTIAVANTNNGELSENVTTSGYIREPLSVYELATYAYDNARSYFIDGRSYEDSPSGWFLHESGSLATPNYTDRLELGSGTLAGVLTADFAGEADVAGIAANHFVFNETNLASYSSYSPEKPAPTVEGDFYLALDGNYVVYAHYKEMAPNRVYEVTEAMSSIGQLTEIVLPAELAPMTQALDLGVELGALLPPGSSLSEMIRYDGGIGVDYYTYRAPKMSEDELLNFYRTLPPTNGWTVTHIGHITPHLERLNCETDIECVILNNGGEQIVISFRGTISLEYDHERIFSPA